MAGFDFRIPVEPKERSFAVALLRHLQRLAGERQCGRPTVIRFSWCRPARSSKIHEYLVTVDGDFAEIEALSFDAMMATLYYSRGYVDATRTHSRSLLPSALALAFFKRTREFASELHGLQSELQTMGAEVSVNTYSFRKTGIETIDRVLQDTTTLLLRWRSGSVSRPILVEQLHTAAEIALKAALQASNRGVTFAALVSKAEVQKTVTQEQSQALHHLKNQRRDAKHRGQGVGSQGLSETVQLVVAALHSVTQALQRGVKPNPSIERTSSSTLRVLPAAAHVER